MFSAPAILLITSITVDSKSQNSTFTPAIVLLNAAPMLYTHARNALAIPSATLAAIKPAFFTAATATFIPPHITPIAEIDVSLTRLIIPITAAISAINAIMPMIISATGLSASTAFNTACAAAHAFVAVVTIAVHIAAPFVAISHTPTAAAMPNTIGAMIGQLLATNCAIELISLNIGVKTRNITFDATVHICDHVYGILLNFLSISFALASIAFFTTSALICPSAAMLRILPNGTSR